MKQWTKKFINKKRKISIKKNWLLENAKGAEKKLGLPIKLWIELSKMNQITQDYEKYPETIFMAGVAVGWAEQNKKIK